MSNQKKNEKPKIKNLIPQKQITFNSGSLKYITDSDLQFETNITKPKKEKVVEPGLAGLLNIGSTCYMNSVIQIFSHTKILHTYFVKSESAVNRKNMISISSELRSILLKLWSGERKIISPAKLFRQIQIRTNKSYRLRQQNDAHEFMLDLISWLHEELVQTTIITDTFNGIYNNIISCSNCTLKKSIKEVTNNLLLPVPSSGECTLQECLERYYEAEELSCYRCDLCNSIQTTTNRKTILKHPKVFIITIRRIHQGENQLEKVLTKIYYPLENLNIDGAIYNLYGVIGHRTCGTNLISGHYYANVKHVLSKCWYKFNDNNVYRIIDAEVVVPVDAYILYYEQVSQETSDTDKS